MMPRSDRRVCCRSRAALRLVLGTALLLAFGAPQLASAADCRLSDRRAATLLFPYFEVDLDGDRTTLIAITNVYAVPTLARITLWTDWALPTLAFDVFLPGNDVLTLNLRDLFLGAQLPRTGPGASAFAGCNDVLGLTIINSDRLQRQHSGRALGNGTCWSSARSDTSLVTGYVTVDVTNRCPGPGVTPATPGYFATPNRVASDDNVLIGDFFVVDPGQNFAGGQNAVSLVVASPLPGPGDYTFYGRYVSFSGSDHRLPLSNRWFTRFLTGGGFDGGTDLIVWRDTRRADTQPFECGVRTPPWLPLGEEHLLVSPESGPGLRLYNDTEVFDLATQRVAVADLEFEPSFGSLIVGLDHRDGTHAQGWIGWNASAQSRFNVSLAGIPLSDPCQLTP